MTISRLCGAALATALLLVSAHAEDGVTLGIDFNDGVITPSRIETSAAPVLRLEVANSGAAAVEFESMELRKEKIIASGGKTILTFRSLPPGAYTFFDDFHPAAPAGILVVK